MIYNILSVNILLIPLVYIPIYTWDQVTVSPVKIFVRAWLKQSAYISQNSWTSKTKVLTDPISGEVPFPGLFAVFTQEEEGAARKRENEKERISKYDFFLMQRSI